MLGRQTEIGMFKFFMQLIVWLGSDPLRCQPVNWRRKSILLTVADHRVCRLLGDHDGSVVRGLIRLDPSILYKVLTALFDAVQEVEY